MPCHDSGDAMPRPLPLAEREWIRQTVVGRESTVPRTSAEWFNSVQAVQPKHLFDSTRFTAKAWKVAKEASWRRHKCHLDETVAGP